MKRRLSGYTLIELLAALAIFSGLMVAVLSVLPPLAKSNRQSRATAGGVAAAQTTLETMARAIARSEVVDGVWQDNQCYYLRGFYLMNANDQPVILPVGRVVVAAADRALVTMTRETAFDPDLGGEYPRWIRRTYRIDRKAMVEETQIMTQPPTACQQVGVATNWGKKTSRSLTAADVIVRSFTVRMAPPFLGQVKRRSSSTGYVFEPVARLAPFATIRLTVGIKPSAAILAEPITLQTTITPLVTLGGTNDF